jgi:hypothetical protein
MGIFSRYDPEAENWGDIESEAIAAREKHGFYTVIGEYEVYMLMQQEDIKYVDKEFKIEKFIKYEDITLIEIKGNYSTHETLKWGLVGLAAGAKRRVIELKYNDGKTKAKINLKEIDREDAENFIDAINARMAPSAFNVLTSRKTLHADPLESIKDAKELLDSGAITQEEFDELKNKYLKMI